MIMELNIDPNFTKYSFAPTTNQDKQDSVIKTEKGDDGQNESMPETPRSNDQENQAGDDAQQNPQRRLSNSVSNAPSQHDEELLDNDLDLDKYGMNNNEFALNQDCSDENDLPEDDGQFKRP